LTRPDRGFPESEYRARTKRAQLLMQDADLSALLLTTEPEVRYYTGFLTRFWESPTRPWFVVVPADGDPIAIIPAIGAHLMSQTWVGDIRTWDAPNYADDGVGLLAATLCETVGDGAKIGLADDIESHARAPLQSLERLRRSIRKRTVVSDAAITRTLRQVKSAAEIAKIRNAACIADRAFARVGEIAASGVPLSTVFRKFQMLCLEEGADWVPYLAGAAAQGGYGDVISPATDTPIAQGDVLMLDTGLVWDGYFCDFDRNFSVGTPSQDIAHAHRQLIDATQAAFEIALPGRKMSDLFGAMDAILAVGPGSGRLGHGLGMQLTEWPSIIAEDETILKPGMVLTLEPYIALPNQKIMVHEENIVIRERGPEFLSAPQSREIRVLC
jgi:Xaa-Pro aminopeptidase